MSGTRWVAAVERGPGKTWHARPELYQATKAVYHMTCPHKHTSEKAAVACAHKMIGTTNAPPERVTV